MNAPAHLHPSDLQGLSRLAVQGVSGTTELVEQLHLAIARVSGPSGPSKDGRTRGITGLVYRSIQGITGLVGGTLDWSLSQIVPRLPSSESTPQRDRVLAALNGVLGDYLERSGNPLALTMNLRQGNSTETALPLGQRRIAVFIHGLCMSAHDWSADPACAEQVDLPQLLEAQAGYQPLHLFYNTGRSIGAKGRRSSPASRSSFGSTPSPAVWRTARQPEIQHHRRRPGDGRQRAGRAASRRPRSPGPESRDRRRPSAPAPPSRSRQPDHRLAAGRMRPARLASIQP